MYKRCVMCLANHPAWKEIQKQIDRTIAKQKTACRAFNDLLSSVPTDTKQLLKIPTSAGSNEDTWRLDYKNAEVRLEISTVHSACFIHGHFPQVLRLINLEHAKTVHHLHTPEHQV